MVNKIGSLNIEPQHIQTNFTGDVFIKGIPYL